MSLILHMLALGGVVLGIAKLLPGVKVDNYGTGLGVAVVYSLLNFLFYKIFGWLALPFVVITLGLMILVLNTFLLWATDQFLDDFEIDSMPITFLAAVLITIANVILSMVLY